MKEIRLSNSAAVALVDDEDYEWLNRWTWKLHHKGHVVRKTTTRERKSIQIYIHRALINPPSHLEVDHIDGNKLDNQKGNLRIATHIQNIHNSAKCFRNGRATSQFKGVYWDKRRERWCARIVINYRRIHIGYFELEEDAAKAYDEKAIEHYEEFARLNFPQAAAAIKRAAARIVSEMPL